MTIQFDDTKYELVTTNQHGTRLQATVAVSIKDIPLLLMELDNITNISVYDGENLRSTYSGFTQKIAVTIYDTEESETKNVSVELENTDVDALIAELSNRVKELETSSEQVNNNLEALNASQDEQNATLDELIMSQV